MIRHKITYGSVFTAVELASNSNFHLLALKRKKQELDILKKDVFTNFDDLILASPDVVSERRGSAPSRPYFDVNLRAESKAYVDFLRRLMDRRLLGVASEKRSLATPFFSSRRRMVGRGSFLIVDSQTPCSPAHPLSRLGAPRP